MKLLFAGVSVALCALIVLVVIVSDTVLSLRALVALLAAALACYVVSTFAP